MPNKSFFRLFVYGLLGVCIVVCASFIIWLGAFYTQEITVEEISIQLDPNRLLVPDIDSAS